MTETIAESLNRYIAQKILKQPTRVIAPDEKLISGGLIDSFHLVDLSIFVEDTFNVRLDDTELNARAFDTITQLADLIARRQSGK
jgi:acyl carrier protein